MGESELRQLALSGLPGALLPEKSVMGRLTQQVCSVTLAKAGSPGLDDAHLFPRSSGCLCSYVFIFLPCKDTSHRG